MLKIRSIEARHESGKMNNGLVYIKTVAKQESVTAAVYIDLLMVRVPGDIRIRFIIQQGSS